MTFLEHIKKSQIMRFLTPVFNYAWKSYLKSTLHLNYKDCEIKILQFKNDTRCGGVPKPCGDDACQAFLPCLRQSASKVIYLSLSRPYNFTNAAGGIWSCLCVSFSAGYGSIRRPPSQLKSH